MKQRKIIKRRTRLILATAQYLIAIHGETTTLDVKRTLRSLVPDEEWKQKNVSETLMSLNYPYRDNGTYRTYYSTNILRENHLMIHHLQGLKRNNKSIRRKGH